MLDSNETESKRTRFYRRESGEGDAKPMPRRRERRFGSLPERSGPRLAAGSSDNVRGQ